MYTLGINAAYHDSAACLVHDGVVLAAAEEERFSRVKHAKRPVPFSAYELPFHAIDFCLARAGIGLGEVDHVVYSYDPYQLLPRRDAPSITLPLEPSTAPVQEGYESPWDPLFLAYVVNAPRQLVDGAPHHLRRRFAKAPDGPEYRWHFLDHHLAHEASAFLASPFAEAAILTLDGRGERATTSYAVGEGTRIGRIGQVDYPHSLGLLYEALTRHLGFLHSSDEYKVMALASFGKPRFVREFRDVVQLGADGAYRVADLQLEARFGPARAPGAALTQHHYDIARSLQEVLEETVLELVHWLHRRTRTTNLCMAGGVALNCVMNGRIARQGPFRRVWVQPAAGDAGTALGAALWVDARQRTAQDRRYCMDHALLGPDYDDETIEAFLREAKLPCQRVTHVPERVADLLAQDKIIGWFQGRMEFGPRALGARSILASPLNATMQARLNAIKDREDFRPVAPVVLEEAAPEWFIGCTRSPFMLFVHDVAPDKRARIPAAVHIDGTARVQTVNREQHPRYHELLRAFAARTGVPVLINTSFNTRGEPIACSPRDAIECFWTSPLDALVIGSFILEKRAGAHGDTRFGRGSDLQAPAVA